MATLNSLKAIAEAKTDGFQKATYFKIHPDKLEFEPGWNLRAEGPELDEHLERLYTAMKAGASVPPIDVTVEDGRVIVRDGHCRTRVAKRLVAEGIDYALEARHYRGNEADCVLHMISSSHGKALTPLEAGLGFQRLMRYGLDVAAIAARTGLSRTTIEKGLVLAEAPVNVQKMIAQGKVAANTAVQVIKKEGRSNSEAVLKQSLEKSESLGKTKVTAKHLPKAAKPTTKTINSELIDALNAAINALRSYQHGNAATGLAQQVADHAESVVAKAKAVA